MLTPPMIALLDTVFALVQHKEHNEMRLMVEYTFTIGS
jgi:hypothetical protein